MRTHGLRLVGGGNVEPKLNQPDGQNIKELFVNILECIKMNKKPACDIEIGHRAPTMALLGMLALKHGRSVQWDANKEVIVGGTEAKKLLAREYQKP